MKNSTKITLKLKNKQYIENFEDKIQTRELEKIIIKCSNATLLNNFFDYDENLN